MDKTQNYKSANKDQFNRQIATENRGKVYKNIVCFPSVLAIDTHASFANGILSKKTNIIAIEKVKSRVKKVSEQLKKHTKKFSIAEKELHSVNLDNYLNNEKVDYLPFDICGNITAQIAKWFFRNQKNFDNNMRFPITIAVNERHRNLRKVVDKVAKQKQIEFFVKMLKNNTVFTDSTGVRLSDKLFGSLANQVYMIVHSMPDKKVNIKSINIYRNSDKSAMAAYMALLDIELSDAKRDIRVYNKFVRIINTYNESVGYNSMAQLKSKAPKEHKKTIVEILGVKNRKDSLTAGRKMVISKYISKFAVDSNITVRQASKRVWGGINRKLTSMERAA
jgi:hypothetical protein